VFNAMFFADRRSGSNLRLGSRESARRSRANRRLQVAAEVLRLEPRCMLSGGVPIPDNPVVPLSDIIWNGGPPLNTATGIQNIPSPSEAGATKTITIRNNGPDMIYPFLTGENIGQDGKSTTQPYYDPQDIMGHEFREYIGYSENDGVNKFFGLPKGASITVQVPLVLWDGDDLFIATDGKDLTNPNIFFYQQSAKISIVGSKLDSGTKWVTKSSGFPAGVVPLIAFYYDAGPPLGVPTAAPAQLTEVTFRDQYLKNFINDSSQTQPLLSYDVSYVNNLVAPVSMEASDVPITFGDTLGSTAPTYYGYKSWGWAATDRDTPTFGLAVKNFNHNEGDSGIGKYFGGKGWPEYYNPNADDIDIPSGGNIFLDSPFNTKDPAPVVHTSPYDSNHWLLTSSGDAPIVAGGGGFGLQGFVAVNGKAANEIYVNNPPAKFVDDLDQMLKEAVVNVTFPGQPAVLAQVVKYAPNDGNPYIQLNQPIDPTGPSGAVFAFSRTASDYAITDITNLWYSWAQYYVNQFQNFAPEAVEATLNYFQPPNGPINQNEPLNEITLTSTPAVPLAVGMTVSAPTGIPSGTTILKIVPNAQGLLDIYLSQIPATGTPASQLYTFSKPQPIPIDAQSAPYTTPFNLTFDTDAAYAQTFAGSVYEAMSAEEGLNPSPYLPDTMSLVGNVIQFYAKLPGFDKPDTGPLLVANVRDIVKSILRGVPDYLSPSYSDQSLWYPTPSTPTGGQEFNVYNLDPYVWFVHSVENMSAYGFSVDDDVANPIATGPLLAPGNVANHSPSNLQIGFGGIGKPPDGFTNQNQWFPTIPWGTIDTSARISDYTYNGVATSLITLVATDPKDPQGPLRLYNEINNPGTGQTGAFILAPGVKPGAPGYITRGTTVIFKGPNGADQPQFVLSQHAIPTTGDTAVPVTITGTLPALTKTLRRRERIN
jgi:hypothetical protein